MYLTELALVMQLTSAGLKWQKVGSTVTCNPPPQDTDIDYIVLKPSPEGELHGVINRLCFCAEGDSLNPNNIYPDSDFASYRKGNLNLIVAKTEQFYSMFIEATENSKALNLMKKRDRIKLFQAILYKNYDDTTIKGSK